MEKNRQITPQKIRQIRKKIENIFINNNLPIDRFVSEIDRTFDFHKAAGKTYGISLTKKDKSALIANNFSDKNIQKLVELLIDIYSKGGIYSGKKYPINGMANLIQLLNSSPSSKNKKAKTILIIDISGSSELVRHYSKKLMEATISDIKNACVDICSKRGGVIMKWEGDGGSFEFKAEKDLDDNNKSICNQAALSGIDVLHWLWEYNLFQNKLDDSVKLKIIVDIVYLSPASQDKNLSAKIEKKMHDLEKDYAEPNMVTLSDSIYMRLMDSIKPYLKSFYIADYRFKQNYYQYNIELQKKN